MMKEVALITLGLLICIGVDGRLSEIERVAFWRQHHSWPPTWQNESKGFSSLMEFREREIMSISGSHERWENWMQFVQSRMVPKFTQNGFEVVKTPPEVAKLLKDAVEAGIHDWDNLPFEKDVEVIYNQEKMPPKFIYLNDIANRVHEMLLASHEAWAGGIKLKKTSVYGVRMYQNGSSLVMHYDKVKTHVISSIIHIAHEYDDEDKPWPIEIEDHDGNLHAVSLAAGEQLFYESAKCLHGRMTEFRGKYYGSLFVHYQPVDPLIWNYTVDCLQVYSIDDVPHQDVINGVPPHWRDGASSAKGSRWAGQAITVDSRVAVGAPPRIISETTYSEL